jgi:NADPH-dependent curcumin reductase CurA
LCISVLQNTTSLFEQAFRILRRLRAAYERQKNLVDVLNRHEVELKSLKTIIGIIEDEEELQKDAVSIELARVKDVQTKLKDLLVSLDPNARGKMNRIARELIQGSANEKKLTAIMHELGTVKQSLLLRIQVAQVGIMRTMQKKLVANADVIQRIDRSLREQVSNCEGLQIARLLKDRIPAGE